MDIGEDLNRLNFQILMLARECARHSPLEAAWRFGLTDVTLKEVANLSLEKILDLSLCGRTVIATLPKATPDHVPAGIHAALIG
jgi:hypothetical protein